MDEEKVYVNKRQSIHQLYLEPSSDVVDDFHVFPPHKLISLFWDWLQTTNMFMVWEMTEKNFLTSGFCWNFFSDSS